MLEFGDHRLMRLNADIGTLGGKEREMLRGLARKVRELSANPAYTEKRGLWKKHNALKSERPMVLAFPEDGWREILPMASMTVGDPFWREYEWYLKYLVNRGERLHDDNVLDPIVEVPMIYRLTGWGMDPQWTSSGVYMGANHLESVLKDPEDAKDMKPLDMFIDEPSTQKIVDAVRELLGDILDVHINRSIDRFDRYINKSLIEELILMRGIEQVYIDMIDRPEWVHGVLQFMQESEMKLMDRIERDYRMDLNNANNHVGSGGLGYSDELPSLGYDPDHVRWQDLWGFSDSQELGFVSPAMFDEFAIQYQNPILSRYGLSCFGCCESLNDKFQIVKKIKNLRRVSVSPWTDVSIASRELEDKYVLSWKPHPAYLTTERFDEDALRQYLADGIQKANGCNIELVFKDTQTFQNKPERIERAVDIAMELACSANPPFRMKDFKGLKKA